MSVSKPHIVRRWREFVDGFTDPRAWFFGAACGLVLGIVLAVAYDL